MTQEQENRRKGHTTRRIDNCIQELYKNGFVVVTDHHDTDDARKDAFRILCKRLSIEHPHDIFIRDTVRSIVYLKEKEKQAVDAYIQYMFNTTS